MEAALPGSQEHHSSARGYFTWGPCVQGRGAPTFVAGAEALRTDGIVTDEMQREGGGRADNGGWQLKACEPERQKRCNLERMIPWGTVHPGSTYWAPVGCAMLTWAKGGTQKKPNTSHIQGAQRESDGNQGSSATETLGATPLNYGLFLMWRPPLRVSLLFSQPSLFSPFLAEVFLGSG